MKRMLAVGGVAAAALVSLAVAGPAAAAYASPRLSITNPSERTGAAAPLTIRFRQDREDDATAKLSIYVPRGYATSFAHQPGAVIGSVGAEVQANALGPDIVVPLSGSIRVESPEDPRHKETLDVECYGASTRLDSVWVLVLDRPTGGPPLEVPVYVTTVMEGSEAAFASAKLQACLPSPYVPESAGGAGLGAKLLLAELTVRGVFTNPTMPGAYRWRALATPYTPGSGAPNGAGAVEIQALDAIPVALTAAARVDHRLNRVTLTGRLTEDAVGASGIVVHFLRGGRIVKSARTNARGRYATVLRLRPGRYTLRVRASKGNVHLGSGACTQTFAPLPCIAATSSSFSVVAARSFRMR